jgi:hypothetical protein
MISAASPARAGSVFTGFNIFSIALEVPMSDVFPTASRTATACPGPARPTA